MRLLPAESQLGRETPQSREGRVESPTQIIEINSKYNFTHNRKGYEDTETKYINNECALEVLTHFFELACVPRPKMTATNLLREFGTVGRALSGSYARLARNSDARVASIVLACRRLIRTALLDQLYEQPILGCEADLMRFLQFELGSLTRERLVSIYVDSRCRLLSVERMANGSTSEIEVNVASIVHRGLDVGAAGFYLAHNHPSGDATPSEADIRITQRLARIGKELDLPLLQHFVVAGGSVSSVLWQ